MQSALFFPGQGEPFAELESWLGKPAKPSPNAPPFTGGVAGLASYSLAERIEQVAGSGGAWPQMVLMKISALLAFDHRQGRLVAVGRGVDQAAAAAEAARAASWLQSAQVQSAPNGALAERLVPDDPQAFEAAVETVRGRIARGDIFQANIARSWTGRLADAARPFEVFRRLCRASPAPYAAWLSLPGLALASNSPERFVALGPDGAVESRPIKGTAPRGANPDEDAALAAGLAASAKDRAENLMIVDLMRNDISRVCAPGSVTAPELFAVETFANVHHLVSTVRGRLRAGARVGDLLRAVFPPGSITGAPKVEAMKLIDELEGPRGPFFGSIFWAGFDGAFDSNVLIRTVAFEKTEGGWDFEARAGGGIVADSQPAAERAETEAKIGAILAALTKGEP